jgi:hypothetical protein
LIGERHPCFVLGIDEVNKVDDADKSNFKDLFNAIGMFSCHHQKPFFVPVFAGTVIGPINSSVTKSTHPPLEIPLPLLSFESCLKIISKKNQIFSEMLKSNNKYLRELIADTGGHARTLEILYDHLVSNNVENISNLDNSDKLSIKTWNNVASDVRHVLSKRYQLTQMALGKAIAKAFLSLPVSEANIMYEKDSITVLDLQERGVVKLEDRKIMIPYFFVSTFLENSVSTLPYSKFWKDLLIEDDFWWQDWEIFNRDYIPFRFSLYQYLKMSTVFLQDFFAGAKMNLSTKINIQIPVEIQTERMINRFPSEKTKNYKKVGVSFLNAPGAPFDSFMFLETVEKKLLLLVFQMKWNDKNAQSSSVISQELVNEEYNKMKENIKEFLPDTDVVFVILSRRKGTFDEKVLPDDCIVVSKDEMEAFYGKLYYQRLLNC